MEEYPIRHRNHVLEKLSENDLNNNLPPEWVLNKLQLDYGTDYNCEIAQGNKVIGTNFSIQLKSKEKNEYEDFVIVKNLKRSTITRWLKKLEPTMIIVYVEELKESFWTWVKEDSFDLTQENKSFQIKVFKENPLSKCDWNEVHNYVQSIFNKRYMLYKTPESLDNRNEEYAWGQYFKNEYQLALDSFNKYTLEENKNSVFWNAIAICEYQLYNYKKALISINKALDLELNSSILLNKATILTEYGFELKDKKILESAKEIYIQLLGNERDSQTLYNYANCLKFLDDLSESKGFYIESLEKNPNNPEAWKNLGSVFHELQHYDTEIECYDNALQINPKLSQALFSKGVTLFKVFDKVNEGLELMLLGESEDEEKNYELGFPYVYFWIAEAYLHLKDMKNALKWNKKGLSIDPTDNYFLLQEERIKHLA